MHPVGSHYMDMQSVLTFPYSITSSLSFFTFMYWNSVPQLSAGTTEMVNTTELSVEWIYLAQDVRECSCLTNMWWPPGVFLMLRTHVRSKNRRWNRASAPEKKGRRKKSWIKPSAPGGWGWGWGTVFPCLDLSGANDWWRDTAQWHATGRLSSQLSAALQQR